MNDLEFDDDEFGEFGGFEAAEPVEGQVTEAAQAAPTPWAVLPVQSNSQTNGTVLQKGLEPHLPEAIATTQSSSASNDNAKKQITQPVAATEDITSNITSKSMNSGHVLSAATVATPPASNQPSSDAEIVGVFDDILADEPKDNSASLNSPLKSSTETGPSKVKHGTADPPSQINTESAAGDDKSYDSEAVKKVSLLQEKLDISEQDKRKLKNELEEVQGLQKQLQGELIELKDQTEKYEKLQAKHATQLEEMRKAGHDALVLIVEEYKELCKTAVLQQQESCQKELQEYLLKQEEQMKKQQTQQQEEISKVLEEERKVFRKTIQNELEKLEEKHKEELATALKVQKEKSEAAVQKAVEAEKTATVKAISDALEEERNKNMESLQQQQDKFNELLEEEQKKSREIVKEAVVEETEKCQKCIAEALDNERKKSDELQKQIKDKTKNDVQSYVKEMKQEEALLRKRQLTSIDLFIKSARDQLDMLISSTEEESNTEDDDRRLRGMINVDDLCL